MIKNCRRCPACGGNAIRVQLTPRSISRDFAVPNGGIVKRATVQQGLHAVSMHVFGSNRHQCSKCDEVFALRPRSFGVNDATDVVRKEVNHVNR